MNGTGTVVAGLGWGMLVVVQGRQSNEGERAVAAGEMLAAGETEPATLSAAAAAAA